MRKSPSCVQMCAFLFHKKNAVSALCDYPARNRAYVVENRAYPVKKRLRGIPPGLEPHDGIGDAFLILA